MTGSPGNKIWKFKEFCHRFFFFFFFRESAVDSNTTKTACSRSKQSCFLYPPVPLPLPQLCLAFLPLDSLSPVALWPRLSICLSLSDTHTNTYTHTHYTAKRADNLRSSTFVAWTKAGAVREHCGFSVSVSPRPLWGTVMKKSQNNGRMAACVVIQHGVKCRSGLAQAVRAWAWVVTKCNIWKKVR